MENSFFEYRDKTAADSSSDNEIINDSLVLQSVPYSVKKKNRTAFVAESDESSSNDEDNKEDTTGNVFKSTRSSSAAEARVICSSEDDGSRRGSLKNPSGSTNNVVLSSSDEEEEDFSPELVPKRRPPPRQKSINPNESLVLQRTKKRMLFQDSDTDNSIIIERNKNNKQKCLKDTPLKIETKNTNSDLNISMDYESCDGDDDDDDDNENDDSDGDSENVSELHTDIRNKCKKLVISSDESDDDENDINHTNTKSSSKSKKMTIESDESDDDGINKKHANDKLSSKSKKLTIESDESDNDNDAVKHQLSTDKKKSNKVMITTDESDQDEIIPKVVQKTGLSIDSLKSDHDYCSNSQMTDDNVDNEEDDDDGPDEDLMVMSRATRMSIMGIIPKDNDSDDSDFIQSDSSSRKTAESRADSLDDIQNLGSKYNTPEDSKTSEKSDDDLPEVTIHESISKSVMADSNKDTKDDDEISIHSNDSRLTCSPFSSPLQDITNKSIVKAPKRKSKNLNTGKKVTGYMDLTVMDDPKPNVKGGVIDLSNLQPNVVKNKVLDKSASVLSRKNEPNHDDDVAIIDSNPEIIALSSDDEDEINPDKKSHAPSRSKSPNHASSSQGPQESMKQYLAPSRPRQVVYVKKDEKEKELDMLRSLKADLNNVRLLLDEVLVLESLPDGGAQLRERHAKLESRVREQGDRVANMVVEPDASSAADMARDGLDSGLTWEEIQKGSNAVQPRMFGKQAMSTHMVERNLILDRLRELHTSMGSRPDESSLAPAPRLLSTTLMPYQRHALAWLQWRETQKPASGILADDMGLGKTITMIALIASDKQTTIDYDDSDDGEDSRHQLARGGTLVVCPASLIQQWASEVTKHCTPHALSVCLHHGAARATQAHRLAVHDMVATTYNIMQRDSYENGVLKRIQWRRIILDEAHIVRNHKSATSTAVSALHGKRRWCLTGTPVQNKDLDLFALLKFLRLSPFDDLAMWKKWIVNKTEGGQERLNIIMQCILLRRTKVQLQEIGQLPCLPARTAHTRFVTLSSEEMNVYQKVLVLSKTLFAQFLHQRAEKNAGCSLAAPGKGSEYDKMHKRMIALQGVKPVKSHEILVLLLRLRQVCCHCGLIGSMLDEATPGAGPEEAGADLLRELDKLSLDDSRRKSKNHDTGEEEPGKEETAKADEAIRAVLASNHPVFQLTRPSSKIAAVMECLDNNVFTNKGDKAVVVSQWTSVLSLVEKELNKKKIRSVTLSGAVTVTARPRLIDQINDPKSDVRVMLLSLCAGGVGINLCGANHLLLLDPHWNPQLEEQAQDRIYRIGQKKPVNIYRFVCVDTVEQTIRKLQEAKLQLADNVLTGAGNAGGSPLSVQELKMMFNME